MHKAYKSRFVTKTMAIRRNLLASAAGLTTLLGSYLFLAEDKSEQITETFLSNRDKGAEIAKKALEYDLNAPPEIFDGDFPVKSGNYEPELDEEFVIEKSKPFNRTEMKPFVLEEVFKDYETYPEKVSLFAGKKFGREETIGELKKRRFIVFYDTAFGDWCAPCIGLEKTGLYSRLEQLVDEDFNGKIGLIKMQQPMPSIFERINAVPRVFISENLEGQLMPLAEIDQKDYGFVVRNARVMIESAVNGRIKKELDREVEQIFRLSEKDFSNIEMCFAVNPREFVYNAKSEEQAYWHTYEHLGLFTGWALFGEKNMRYDKEKNQINFNIDLNKKNNFTDFLFALSFGYDRRRSIEHEFENGRNILGSVSARTVQKTLNEQKINPNYKKIGEWFDSMLTQVWDEDPLTEKHSEKHSFVIEQFYNFSRGVRPRYIEKQYDAFVSNLRAIYFGSYNGDYPFVQDFSHPIVQEKFKEWCQENGRKIERHRLPTKKEVEDFSVKNGVPKKSLEELCDSLGRIKKAYETLEANNVIYFDFYTPLPVLEKTLEEKSTAVVLRGVTPIGFIEKVENAEDLKPGNSIGTLIHATKSFPADKNTENLFIYLPRYATKIGLGNPQFVGISSWTEPFCDSTYGPMLFFFRKTGNGEFKYESRYFSEYDPQVLNKINSDLGRYLKN